MSRAKLQIPQLASNSMIKILRDSNDAIDEKKNAVVFLKEMIKVGFKLPPGVQEAFGQLLRRKRKKYPP